MTQQTTRTDTFVLIILGVSLALNAYLGLQVLPRKVSAQASLQPQTRVPDLQVETADGRRLTVSANGEKPVLLYTFTTTCAWCRLNKPMIESIAQQVAARYRFVPVCLDCNPKEPFLVAGTAAFVKPSDGTLLAYKLGYVPMTAVVSTTGEVQSVWRGAFVGEQLRSEIESTLDVKLPTDTPTAGTP